MGVGYDCRERPPRLASPDMPTVHVLAADPVRRAVVAGGLARRTDVEVATDPVPGAVVVAVGATVDEALHLFQRARLAGNRLVIVADTISPAAVFKAVRAGAGALLPHDEADQCRLEFAIHAAAAGDGMSRETLDRLLDRAGTPATGERLTDREVRVLRLVADGYGNADIACQLDCSPHTVKNVIHDLMSRLRLRNRTHAAAYAVRSGLA